MGEDELLSRILPHFGTQVGTEVGPGDDAAVVDLSQSRVVICTDILVEGVHFESAWSNGADVGWRAVMANLADVAAMGARGRSVVAAVTAPAQSEPTWFESLASGMAQACQPHGVDVTGGDLSVGPCLSVAVTALGLLDGRAPVRRSGARAGDILALAGQTGWSMAGYQMLLASHPTPPNRESGVSHDPENSESEVSHDPKTSESELWHDPKNSESEVSHDPENSESEVWQRTAGLRQPAPRPVPGRCSASLRNDARHTPGARSLPPGLEGQPGSGSEVWHDPKNSELEVWHLAGLAVQAYRRPVPPLAAGPAAAVAGATAMLDVSDGLLMDAGRLAQASGVDLVIDPEAATLAKTVQALAPLAAQLERNPLDWVLTGGEDHALLATFPTEGGLPEGWAGIGHCEAGQGQVKLLGDYQPPNAGWDHFA